MQAFGAELVMGICHGSITHNICPRVGCQVERVPRYWYAGQCRISDLTSIEEAVVIYRRSRERIV